MGVIAMNVNINLTDYWYLNLLITRHVLQMCRAGFTRHGGQSPPYYCM